MIGKSTQIQWRRDKVREYSIKGWSQRDIAEELQVSLKLVNKDILFMKQQAKDNIQHYIDEDLPLRYQNCLNALEMIVKEMWSNEPGDYRERIQSRTLIKDCCAMTIDLLSNAVVIDKAVRFVDKHRGLVHENKEVVIDDPTGIREVSS